MKYARKPSILIIDDDRGVIRVVSRLVEKMGMDADYGLTLEQGMEKHRSGRFDIVLLDVRLPDGNGLDAIDTILEGDAPPQVIIMTAFFDPGGAALAIENGAWDYIQKPASPQTVERQIMRALQYREQKRTAESLPDFKYDKIIGSSKRIRSCLTQASRIACSQANVLITGETGTGKELFAKAIHDNSPRRHKAFIVVDCSILTETLIESVLFGHEKGAFTGADRDRSGLAKLANGGTLFLDEVGELPESAQSSFLRMLQEKKFRPVGSDQEIASDFRVVSATNIDLDRAVETRRFRSDLRYRLQSFTLALPPLRLRGGDILDIARHYTMRICRQNHLSPKEFSRDFMEVIEKYDWPGNIRELINAVEVSVASALNEERIFAFHLPRHIRARVAQQSFRDQAQFLETPVEPSPRFTPGETLKDVIARTEKAYLFSLYNQMEGNIRDICLSSGVSRAVLYRKLKKHSIR
ncbi:MAG: sigma-54 dependent transcriptional regulator [Desulfobacter sp.]